MSSTSKPKVYSSAQLDPEFVQRLIPRCNVVLPEKDVAFYAESLDYIPGTTVFMNFGYHKVDAEFLDRAGPSLKAVCLHSVGHNYVDLQACKDRNVKVTYLGHVTAGPMAEFTIGLMIAAGRRFKEGIADVCSNQWSLARRDHLLGHNLINSTVGIVGLGNIGQELVSRLKAFNVKKILYTGPRRKPEGDALGVEFTTFDDLLRNSDFVVPMCDLNATTQHLFDRRAFSLMKPTAVFVNVTRGGVVDQDALIDALTTKRIMSAGLDVCTPEPLPANHPLAALDNCFLVPHIGTHAVELQAETKHFVIDQVLAILDGRPVPLELVP